jgi:RHS repeat-associated protein
MQVTCYTTGSDGTCDTAVPDTPYFDTKTFEFDHTPSITEMGVESEVPGELQGVVKYHVEAAPNGNNLIVERLGGSSSPSFGSGACCSQDPDYAASFSSGVIPAPDSASMILLTVDACGDKKVSTVVNMRDNECPTGGDPAASSCPSCAGKPIRLSNGNIRMTDRDPLPGSELIALSRTYDSLGVPGFFGNGWTSLFDANVRTYQSQTLGTTFLEAKTVSNSQYLFQNVGGGWIQMWPRGTTPAILTPGAGTFSLREPRSATETIFDAGSGRVLRIRSRLSAGREAVISYDGSGVPSHVADSWGNWSWTITPDAANRINSIAVDGTSLVWIYNRDGSGNLVSVSGPSGAAWRNYTYDGNGLTAAYDARGTLIESHAYAFTHGSTHATSSISDQDDIALIDYALPGRNDSEQVTRTTSATGATTDYYTRFVGGRPRTVQVVGHCATCGTNDAVYAYDPLSGDLLREQDARGYITIRDFDQNDRVTTLGGPYRPSGCDPATDPAHCRQTPDSLLTVPLTPTAVTLTITYAYGDINWPEIATFTTTDSVLVPGQARTVAVQLDAATGMVTQQITTGQTDSPAQSVQYTITTALYDGVEGPAFDPGGAFVAAWMNLAQPAGLRKSSDGPRTDVADTTTSVYYPIDGTVAAAWRGRLAAVRNAAGHITRFENYDVFGNAGRTVDPNGIVTESSYDTIGRSLTSTLKAVSGCDTTADPLCATDIVSSRAYLPALGPLASTTTPRGGTTTYEYDDRGRTAATTRQISASSYERIEYDYDPATGHKSAERYLGGHPGAWTTTRSDAFQYDSFGRLSEIDHPDGSKVVYHYDGANNLISVQDERHTTPNTTYAYDPANRLASVTQILSSAAGGQIATAYAYDLHGNLASVTDPNGNVTSYIYDDFGRMIRQTSPVTGITNYAYDALGNLSTMTDANNATTSRTYDAVNRVLSAVSSKTDSDTETVTYGYDASGAGRNGVGRLTTMNDPANTASYNYDRRGLLTTVADSDLTTAFSYDADGNRSNVTYPSGRLVQYTFDFAGRPLTAFDGTPLVSSASYLPFGPATSIAYGNGTTKTMQYDARYRVTENKLTTPVSVIADYLYQEDATGNITQIHDATNAAYNRDFGYDDINRLTAANSGTSLWGAGTYQYDAMGNITSLHIGSRSLSFSYLGSTPKIQSVSGSDPTSPFYDSAGNDVTARTYSARNLLTHVASGTDEIPNPDEMSYLDYFYDGRGVRISSSLTTPGFPPWGGTKTRRSVYSPELHLLGQSDWAAFALDGFYGTEYVWFADQPVAQVSSDSSQSTRYTFTDHLGTPILQTDAAAAVVWRAEYEPYGSVYTYRAGDAGDPQALRFPGQEAPESGLSNDEYNIFRWYRSGWGRYTQTDPIGLSGGLNLFQYAASAPFTYSDHNGLVCGVTVWTQEQEVDMSEGWENGFKRSWGHRWVEWPGGSAGFWPGIRPAGPTASVPGSVHSPDKKAQKHTSDETSQDTYFAQPQRGKCTNCGAVLTCLSNFAKTYSSDYCLLSNNCRSFVDQALALCGLTTESPASYWSNRK